MIARARQRRLPGPPAPPSWTRKPQIVKSRRQLEQEASESARRMDRLPDLTLPAPGSLQYMAMRKLAVEWTESLHVHNGHWLSIIPQHLKQALLAFLLVYGPDLVPVEELELLFLDSIEGESVGSGADQITHAHLGFATSPVTDSTRGYKGLARFLFGNEYLKSAPKCKSRQSGPVTDEQGDRLCA